MIMSNEKIAELVDEYGLLSETRLDHAKHKAEVNKEDLGRFLVMEGYIKDKELGQVVADYLKVPYVSLSGKNIDNTLLELIPEDFARFKQVIPFEKEKEIVHVAAADPYDLETVYLLKKKIGGDVRMFYSTAYDIESAATQYRRDVDKIVQDLVEKYRRLKEIEKKTGDVSAETTKPLVQIVDTIIRHGYLVNASDIHFEPHDKDVVVRFRIDGVLHDSIYVPKELSDLMVTRIKILARLRTDEHMAAQDGKIVVRTERGEKTDIRVSIIPITAGEKVVMRLMPERVKQFSLTELGFSDKMFDSILDAIKRPHGMILATGPTGSGKTTTLYAILRELNSREVNIATIEDPVEYEIDGVNQIQVNQKTSLTFAKGLRSILRQDPDIIMVGEIRDEDTASIAVNAAMTGHLVLSTLHTNDSTTTLPRLVDMGIEPFLIASSVNVAIAQRLLRKVCSQCIESYSLPRAELQARMPQVDVGRFLGKEKSIRLYRAQSCAQCNGTGYRGRVGVFEILVLDDEIRDLIMQNANSDQLRNAAMKRGMTTLLEDGMKKAMAGVTTIDEVLRLIYD